MNDDKATKKSWTSPTLETLQMASTAGGRNASRLESEFPELGALS